MKNREQMKNINLHQSLSKNFTLAEFCKSDIAARNDIDNNQPSDAIISCAKQTCLNLAQPIRDKFGAYIISSGYRCLELNNKLPGAKNSQHIKGEAIDIEVPGITNYHLASWIRDNLIFDQLILEFYLPLVPRSGWVHISFTTRQANRQQIKSLSLI